MATEAPKMLIYYIPVSIMWNVSISWRESWQHSAKLFCCSLTVTWACT